MDLEGMKEDNDDLNILVINIHNFQNMFDVNKH